MSLTPATARQIPDHSIMDYYGKQCYLGNAFSLPIAGFDLTSTSETPIALIQNPALAAGIAFPNGQGLFFTTRRMSSSAQQVQCKYYFNPTFSAIGIETVVTVADSSGSLNNKYWTFYLPGGAGFYVWYNINSAGTDPAVAGLTGIEVSAATNATNTTIATDTKTAINAATAGTVATVTGHTITLTMVASGPFTPAADSSGAATSFTFATTGGVGSLLTPVNCRPAYQSLAANAAIGVCSLNPIVSANGTLVDTLEAPEDFYISEDAYKQLVLDPGYSLLVTATAGTDDTYVNVNFGWNQI